MPAKKIKPKAHSCDWQLAVTEVKIGKAYARFTVYLCPGCGSMGDGCIDYHPDSEHKFVPLHPRPMGSALSWTSGTATGDAPADKNPKREKRK